jgi:hypothetical protein
MKMALYYRRDAEVPGHMILRAQQPAETKQKEQSVFSTFTYIVLPIIIFGTILHTKVSWI